MKYAPHNYQKEVIKFIISHGAAGILLDPGLGKTSSVLAAYSLLKKKGLVRRMLVIAPLRAAHSVWPGEVQKWDDFQHLSIVVAHGPKKLEAISSEADITVINPEGLGWYFANCKDLPDVLVVDESTRFKHTTTARFKTLRPHIGKFKRRYILTGSPAPNGLLDLFGQIYILDLGNALGQYVSHYRMNYFNGVGYGGYTYVLREGAADAIYKKLQPLVIRMSGADYLELPPLIYNPVEVELPKAARAVYDQMETMLLASLEEDVVTAANAAAATNKCRQIANGGIYHEGGKEWAHLHDEKTDAVEEIIEELSGKPALVAYEYAHDLDRLRRRFGDSVPHIGGGVSAARFKEIERGWNAGDIPILLAQPQSVAHGLNLQGTGAAVIWHSIPWDLEVYEQFIRRVWRQGQKETVVVHQIAAKGTVDKVILKLLEKKDRTQQNLLTALKSHLRRSR